MTVIGALSSFREPGEMNPHKTPLSSVVRFMTRRRLMGHPAGGRMTGNRQTVFNSQHHCGEQPCGYLITREN